MRARDAERLARGWQLLGRADWWVWLLLALPAFFLSVAFLLGLAFSPTDTMPLTRWAKWLMGTESVVSIATVLVGARAINTLGS